MTTCAAEGCDKPVPPRVNNGPIPRYCTKTCAMRVYNLKTGHRKKEHIPGTIRVCPVCGGSFALGERSTGGKVPTYCGKAYCRTRGHNLWARYGVNATQYDEMVKQQNGVCALCKEKCSTGGNLSVDHNHETGRVRGLLCRTCNTRLAWFENNRTLILEYIGE